MKYVFEYKTRSDIISDNVDDTVALLYNQSYPEVDFIKEIIPKCRQIREDYKKDNKGGDPNDAFYLTGKNGKKYLIR